MDIPSILHSVWVSLIQRKKELDILLQESAILYLFKKILLKKNAQFFQMLFPCRNLRWQHSYMIRLVNLLTRRMT